MSDTKYCKDCKNMNCPENRVNCKYPDAVACAFYRDTPPTVFDRITGSPEVLAEAIVYEEYEHSILDTDGCGATFPGGYTSAILDFSYGTKAEAIAATVEKLKEVEKQKVILVG